MGRAREDQHNGGVDSITRAVERRERMRLVIDIDENTYNDIEKGKVYTSVRDVPQESVLAIRHGKPLDTVLDKIGAEIEPKCDRINSLASVLPYTAHREIQELLCEIMDLCKAERGGEE